MILFQMRTPLMKFSVVCRINDLLLYFKLLLIVDYAQSSLQAMGKMLGLNEINELEKELQKQIEILLFIFIEIFHLIMKLISSFCSVYLLI